MSSAAVRTALDAERLDGRAPVGPQSWLLSAATPTRLMVLAFALGAFIAAAFAPQLLWDGDTLWHVRTGEWMLTNHQVVAADPFSYTAHGRPWVDLEWLSEILMAPVYAAGGLSGLVLAFALAIGGLAWIMGSELARKLPPFSAGAVLFLALACTTQSWLARPHLLALPILALWTVQLLRAREAGRSPPLWLLPVMTLWANLHGSFLFGLALLGPFALEALVEAGADRLKVLKSWTLFGLAALAASLLTPHGVQGIIYPVRLMTMRVLPDIIEWQSSNFSHPTPLELSLLTALFALLYRGVRVPVVRLLTLIALLHLALHQTRHQMVLAVVGSLLLAEPLGRALIEAGPSLRLPDWSAARRTLVLVGFLTVGLAVGVVRLFIPASLTDGPTAPIAAYAHVPESLRRQPVLNEYGMGGYLVFNHVAPFVDGRADMYGDDFIETYLKAKTDPVRLKALIAKYGMRWTLLAADNPAVAILDSQPGWKRLYTDKVAVVQVKTGG